MGGEPLMHPDLEGWIRTIRMFWPNPRLTIVSNGTLLLKTKNLYNILKDYRVRLKISVHNYNWLDPMIADLEKFFPGPYSLTAAVDDHVFFSKNAQDEHGVQIEIRKYSTMHQSTILDSGVDLHPHDSDPVFAHKICTMKSCHHMVNGKMYKCGVQALIKRFSEQFTLTLTAEQQTLIDKDYGIDVQQASHDLGQFRHSLQAPVEHCKLCPEKLHYSDISAAVGKKKIPIAILR